MPCVLPEAEGIGSSSHGSNGPGSSGVGRGYMSILSGSKALAVLASPRENVHPLWQQGPTGQEEVEGKCSSSHGSDGPGSSGAQ